MSEIEKCVHSPFLIYLSEKLEDAVIIRNDLINGGDRNGNENSKA